jgi:serine/threonine protein kinase
MTEPVAAFLFYQLLNGLHELQRNGLCHRDIKCENILLNDKFILKIADFGYASSVAGSGVGDHANLFSLCGTDG